MRNRLAFAVLLWACALAVSGCHKKAKQAYQPPPPPPVRSAGNGGWTRPVRPETGTVAPPLAPAPVPGNLGRPVSSEVGLASWYGPPYAGRKGADGTVYDQNAMTA